MSAHGLSLGTYTVESRADGSVGCIKEGVNAPRRASDEASHVTLMTRTSIVLSVVALALASCAGGQARMASTSAESAEDARRLQAMLSYCVAPQGDGIVAPLVSVTPSQAADAATYYLRRYYTLQIQNDAGYMPPAAGFQAQALARATTDANRTAACMRNRYAIPVTGPALLPNGPGGEIRDKPTMDLVGNMGSFWLGH